MVSGVTLGSHDAVKSLSTCRPRAIRFLKKLSDLESPFRQSAEGFEKSKEREY